MSIHGWENATVGYMYVCDDSRLRHAQPSPFVRFETFHRVTAGTGGPLVLLNEIASTEATQR